MLISIYFLSTKHIVDKVWNVLWMIKITLFKFWTAFDADKSQTNLVSCEQVEATNKILKTIDYFSMKN